MKNSQENVKEKPYQLVIDHVRGEILHGNLKPGDRLPGENRATDCPERGNLRSSWGSAAIP